MMTPLLPQVKRIAESLWRGNLSLVEPGERQRARVETYSPGLDTLGRGRPRGSTSDS
jgi:hypothetical protein